MSKFTELAEAVTAQLLKELESGSFSFQKCWASAGPAKNYATARVYEGFNQFYLSWKTKQNQFKTPYFITYRQAKELGGWVRKGEKATEILFWKVLNQSSIQKGNEPDDSHKQQALFFPFVHYVFNIDQVEGIAWRLPEIISRENSPIEEAAAIVSKMPAAPLLRHGGNDACYIPSRDTVQMPPLEYFNGSANYYHILFHELIHATGHHSRLNRFKAGEVPARFGDVEYSKEELIAEIGASYLSAQCGISETTVKNSAAYLRGWLAELDGDKTLLVYAANKALKAANCILNAFPPAEEGGIDNYSANLNMAA